MMRPSRSCSALWRSLPGLVLKNSQPRSDIAYEVDFGEIADMQAVPAPQSCSQHWLRPPGRAWLNPNS